MGFPSWQTGLGKGLPFGYGSVRQLRMYGIFDISASLCQDLRGQGFYFFLVENEDRLWYWQNTVRPFAKRVVLPRGAHR